MILTILQLCENLFRFLTKKFHPGNDHFLGLRFFGVENGHFLGVEFLYQKCLHPKNPRLVKWFSWWGFKSQILKKKSYPESDRFPGFLWGVKLPFPRGKVLKKITYTIPKKITKKSKNQKKNQKITKNYKKIKNH